MRHLDLFSGIGGFALAARWCGWETVAFCEIDPYCQKVLRKHWPDVPIYPDVRELHGDYIGSVDVITGGYPCQPFSTAGKRAGADDDRHLWPEVYRLVRAIRPQFVLLENVAGHITMGLDDVLSDLEEAAYTWEAFVIPACAVGRCQRRDRVWVLAYSMPGHRQVARGAARSRREPEQIPRYSVGEMQGPPDLVGGVDGVSGELDPYRMDRLRGLGNAIVPQVAYEIMQSMAVVTCC